jgi:hypothetical protein
MRHFYIDERAADISNHNKNVVLLSFEQETHPLVKAFLQNHARPESEQLIRKRRAPENNLDTENEEYDEEKEQETQEDPNQSAGEADAGKKRPRGKQAANVKTGGRPEAGKIPAHSPAHRARRVHAPPPPASPDLSPVRAAASPAVVRGVGGSIAAVDALRDSRRTLRSVVQDPLDDVRREAAAAAPAAPPASAQHDKSGIARDGRRAKSLFLDPTDPGRKCEVLLILCCRIPDQARYTLFLVSVLH